MRPESVETFQAAGFTPATWLLSAHRLTPQTERLALWVRECDKPLYADNGAKELIDRVALGFAAK